MMIDSLVNVDLIFLIKLPNDLLVFYRLQYSAKNFSLISPRYNTRLFVTSWWWSFLPKRLELYLREIRDEFFVLCYDLWSVVKSKHIFIEAEGKPPYRRLYKGNNIELDDKNINWMTKLHRKTVNNIKAMQKNKLSGQSINEKQTWSREKETSRSVSQTFISKIWNFISVDKKYWSYQC